MFKEDETHYCPMCEQWAEKYERKEQEHERLKRDYFKQNEWLQGRKKEVDQLKQTLVEIKEIATHCMKQDICTTCDNSDKCHLEDEEIPTYDVCKLILQKISEVEDEN